MEKITINEISISTLKFLFYEWKKNRPVSRSLFLSKNKEGTYIAVDNKENGFSINEFNSLEKALFWLASKNIAPDEVNKIDSLVIKAFNDNCNYNINKYSWVTNGLSFGC